MKKILLAAFITGAVAAAFILYFMERTPEEKTGDNIADAAEDAYDTMNKHMGKIERNTEDALGGA